VARKNCFKCRTPIEGRSAKTGLRRNGSRWHLCEECSLAFRAERLLDQEAARRADLDTEMGWNGTPSEASLRRRTTT
jgi:hypothetical protein